jgi:hypothetical protein
MERFGKILKKNLRIKTLNQLVMITIGWKHALKSLKNKRKELSTTKISTLKILK